MVAEPVVPAPSAKRELVSAPTVPAETAMGKAVVESVSGMMCKGVATKSVPAEAVPSKSTTTVFVAAMVSPSEPAPLTPFVVTASAMSKFVGKPATAVMPMSAMKSAVSGPAKFRISAVMPTRMTFVSRPAMPAASVSVTAKAVVAMMVVAVTVVASPGQSVAMTAPFAAFASVSLTLASFVPALGPFFSVTVAPESIAAESLATVTIAAVTLAMRTRSRLFVPHVAVSVASASAALGVLARSPFTMFSLARSSVIAFGELTHATPAALARSPLPLFSFTPLSTAPLSKLTPVAAAPAVSRPRSLVGVVAIRIAVATSGIVSPCSAGPFASSIIAVCVSIITAVVSHLVRAHFVRRQSSPIPVGRELHQCGRRDSTKKQKHVSSHFPTALHPLATRLLSAAAWVTLAGLP
jgi:hypothetical protein